MDWAGQGGGVVLHHLPSPSMPVCLCGCGNRKREKNTGLDTGSIIIGINNNSHNSRREIWPKKKDGLADGAGLDVGIWFNFKLIFPQQAPLAMPRA